MLLGLKGKRKPPGWLKPVVLPKQQKVVHESTITAAASSSSSSSTTLPLALVPNVSVVPPAGSTLAHPAVKSTLAQRIDAPKVAVGAIRASRPTTSLNDDDRVMLLREYESDVRTRSAKAATESNWHSWLLY